MPTLILSMLLTLQQMQPHTTPHQGTGFWWTHWTWMLLWIVIAVVVIALVVRLLWPRQR